MCFYFFSRRLQRAWYCCSAARSGSAQLQSLQMAISDATRGVTRVDPEAGATERSIADANASLLDAIHRFDTGQDGMSKLLGLRGTPFYDHAKEFLTLSVPPGPENAARGTDS
jgi:hypothetical protein